MSYLNREAGKQSFLILSYTLTAVPGNLYYAAPEASQPQDHSPAMDVYSYGVLLMEMSLHEPPGLTMADKEGQILKITWPTMKNLVEKCMNKDLFKRPSMSQILLELI